MKVYGSIANLVHRLGHHGRASLGGIRVQRERLVDALWDGWDRSLGSVGARWEPISNRIRAQRERLVDALRDGWDGFRDSVGARWEPISNSIRARRERLVDALWDGWDGSLDSVGARWRSLSGKLRSRREGGGGYRAERIGQNMGRRSLTIVGTSLGVVVMVTMAVVLLRDRTAPPEPPTAPSAERSGPVDGVNVPDVRGIPASDARAELEHAGLEFAEPRPALGTPGLVLWTEPQIGRSVRPGTPVTIVIGVEAERIDPASS